MGYLKVDLTKYRPFDPVDKTLKVDITSGNAISGAEYLGGKFLSGAGEKLVGAANMVRGTFYQITGNRYEAEKLYATNPVSKYAASLDEMYDAKGAMRFAGDVASGIGQNAVTALISLVPVVGGGIATGVNVLGYTGMGVEEAYAKTGNLDARTYAYGFLTGTMDSVLEYGAGKIGGWIGKSAFGKGAASLSGKVSAGVMNASAKSGKLAVTNAAKQTLKSGLSEFAEEFIEAYAEVGLSRALKIDPNASITFGQALYQGAVGFGAGAGMGAVSAGVSSVSMQKYGRAVMGADGTDTTIAEAREVAHSYSGKTSPVIRSIQENLALWDQIGNKSSTDAAQVLGNIRMAVDTMEAYAIQGDAIERITKNPAKYAGVASQMFGKQVSEKDLSDPNGKYTRALALASFASGVLDRYSVKAKMRMFTDTIQKEASGATSVTPLSAAKWEGQDAIFRADDGEYLIVATDKDGTYSLMWGEDTNDMEGTSGLDEAQVRGYLESFAKEEQIVKDAARVKADADAVEKRFGAEARAQREALENIRVQGAVQNAEWKHAGQNKKAATRTDSENVRGASGVRYYVAEENLSIKEQLRSNQQALNNMDPVAKVTYAESTRGAARKKASELFRRFGYEIDRKGFGKIMIGENELDESFKYLGTQGEFAAISAVPYVLKRGVQLATGHNNHKDRGFSTVTFAAPVEINGTVGNMAVAVKLTGKNRYKTHRILMPDGSGFVFDTKKDAEPTPSGMLVENGEERSDINSASDNRIPEKSENVKRKTKKISDGRKSHALSEDYIPTKKNTEHKDTPKRGDAQTPSAPDWDMKIHDAESRVEEAEQRREKANREMDAAKKRVNILKNEVQSVGRAAVFEYDAAVQDRARKVFGKGFDALSFERRVAIMDMLESAASVDDKTVRAVSRILSGRKNLFLRFGAELNGSGTEENGNTYVSTGKKNGFTQFSGGGRFIAISGETDAVRETVFHEIFHTVAYTAAGRTMIHYALGGMNAESAKKRAIRYGELFHETCDIPGFQEFLGKREFSIEEIYAYDVKYKDRMNGNTLAEEVASVFIGKNLAKSNFTERLAREGGILGMLASVKRFGRYIRAHGENREAMKYVRGLEKIYTAALAEDRSAGNQRHIETTRYAFIGRTEDGKGIYRSNYPENTLKTQKQKDIINFVQNVWSKKPIKLQIVSDGKPMEIEARFNPELTVRSDLAKIAFGNKKGNASEQRITLNLSSDLYQIASESRYVGNKQETGKDNVAHAGVTQWHYFLTDLVYEEANGTRINCYMNIDVKQNDNGNWFYSFAIEKGVAPPTLLAAVTDKSATTPINRIPQNFEFVKEKTQKVSEISEKNSDGGKRYALSEDDRARGIEVADFIESVNRMLDQSKRTKRKKKIGVITDSHATIINTLMQTITPGFNAEGYELWIDGTGAQHIEIRHGENGKADRTMASKKAKALIPWAAQNAETGEFIRDKNGDIKRSDRFYNSDGTRAPEIRLEKNAPEHIIYVSECVPDSVNKRIWITSAYANKKGSKGQLLNMEDETSSPQPTPEAFFDSNATTNRIPQNSEFVKEKAQKVSEVSEKTSDGTDEAYRSAVEGGDMDTAQKMVEEAAARAGYTVRAYHGTQNGNFTVFDKNRLGKGNDQYGAGFYFASDKGAAEHYGKRVIGAYLKMEKPLNIGDAKNLYEYDKPFTQKEAYEIIKAHPDMFDGENSPLGDYFEEYWETGTKDWMIRSLAGTHRTIGDLESDLFQNYPNELHEAVRRATGYDGVEVSVKGGKFYVAWFDNQMKSADPVTYDNNGNVIPLSKRFDTGNSDIRYSLRESAENERQTRERVRESEQQAREAKKESAREKSRQRAATKAVILARELAQKITKRQYIPSKLLMAPEVQNFAAVLSKVQLNYRLREPELRDAVKHLAGWYQEETFREGDGVMACYSNEVREAIVQISTGEGNLSVEEEQGLAKILGNMDKILRDYDKVIVDGKRESATELAKKEAELLDRYVQYYAGRKKNNNFSTLLRRAKGFVRNMMYTIIAPEQVVMSLDQFDKDGVLTKLYHNVMQGETGMGAMYADLMTPFEDYFRGQKRYRERLFRETVQIDGTEIGVGQAIALLLTSKRDQAKEGLELSGIRFENADGEVVRLNGQKTLSLLAKIPSALTREDRAFIALVEKFFASATKIKTEADIAYFGYTNVTEGYYFPILRDAMEIARKITDARDAMKDFAVAANQSFNKNTVKNAKNGLYIANVADVIAKHANGLSVYANLYAPLSAFDMVWNRRIHGTDGSSWSVRELVNDKIWTGSSSGKSGRKLRADEYFRKVFSDIQGVHAMHDVTNGIYNKIREMYTMSVLGLNAKVILSQTASYPSALVCLDAASLVKGAVMRADEENMLTYSKVARARFFDKAYIEGEGNVRRGRGSGALQKVREFSNAGIGWMDKFTISHLFNACKVQVERKHGYAIGTKENLIEAGKLLDEVITKTQPTYTQGTRSALQRSDNAVMRTFAMFSSVAVKQLSYVYEGIGNFAATCHRVRMGIATEAEKKAAWRGCVRALTALTAANVMYVLICQLFKRLTAKDLDDGESIPEDMAGDMISVTLGMFPIISDTYDILVNRYEAGNFFYDAFNDIVTSVGNSAKLMAKMAGGKYVPSEEMARSARELLFSVCTLTGISGRNAYNFVSGITKRLSPSAGYTMSAFFGNASFSANLEKAVERGDEKLAVKILELQLKNKRGLTSVTQETAEELLALSEADYDIAPPSIPSDIRAAERKKIEKILAGADDALEKLLKSEEYDALPDEARASTVRSIYRAYTEYAKWSVLEDERLGVKAAFLPLMSDPSVYFAALGYISELKADRGSTGKPVAGSRSAKVKEYLNSLDLTETEKYLILYAAGFRSESVTGSLQKLVPKSGADNALTEAILSLLEDDAEN